MKKNYVSYNGILKIKNSKLVNKYNEIIKLKGISTHGIQWFKDLVSKSIIKSLKDEFNINAIRIAMYTEEDGYIYHEKIKENVKEIVNYCIELDMYVIIDWHILKDNNPNFYYKAAAKFFNEMSFRYRNYANVLYEICNEPNGDSTWDKDIKPYAEKIIPIIRNNSPNSIIIVGTENYSQRVDIAANNPLKFKNILYSLHFYAASHKQELRDKFIYAINKDLPIIVSEFGVSDAETNSKINLEECKIWLELLKSYNISLFNWSLSNKNEASSLLVSSFNSKSISDECLTESGKFIKEQYKKY